MIGLISYGVYLPQFRIKTEEIASYWGRNSEEIISGLGVREKTVASLDEDALTLAVESSLRALENSQISPEKIEAVIVGSESHPYAVKPTSTILGNYLNLSPNYLAVDTEFACKAATAGLLLISGLIESGKIQTGLIVGSDTAQAKPGDALEYTAGSASVSYILGNKNPIALLTDFSSSSSDTPDFWRRDGQKFPSHAGRFSGETAYFAHIKNASQNLLEKTKLKPADFDYGVFHMPNGKFPRRVAQILGFTPEQIAPSLLIEGIGNPYSASSLLGLASVLDIALPNQKIFVCSYGSGAGSDAFIIKTTREITNFQKQNRYKVKDQLTQKTYIDYGKLTKILMAKGYIG